MKRNSAVVLATTRRTLLLFFIVLLLGTLSSVVQAQRFDGTLRGDVSDESGAVVPDAKITLTNQDTGVSQTTTTTSAGSYIFPNLLAGTYTLSVERDGFQKYQRQGIQVNSNQTIDANVRLSVGATTTTIEVSAGADLVQTSNSTLTNTFDTRLVTDLPNNGATPLQLALFAPESLPTAQESKVMAARSAGSGPAQTVSRSTERTTTT